MASRGFKDSLDFTESFFERNRSDNVAAEARTSVILSEGALALGTNLVLYSVYSYFEVGCRVEGHEAEFSIISRVAGERTLNFKSFLWIGLGLFGLYLFSIPLNRFVVRSFRCNSRSRNVLNMMHLSTHRLVLNGNWLLEVSFDHLY
jgi:hypothetical protein